MHQYNYNMGIDLIFWKRDGWIVTSRQCLTHEDKKCRKVRPKTETEVLLTEIETMLR